MIFISDFGSSKGYCTGLKWAFSVPIMAITGRILVAAIIKKIARPFLFKGITTGTLL